MAYDTICRQVSSREPELRKIAAVKDVIVFVPTEHHGNRLIDFMFFERIVGDVWVDGKNLGDLLYIEGFYKNDS